MHYMYLSFQMFIHPFLPLSNHPSIHLSIYPSIHLSIHSSIDSSRRLGKSREYVGLERMKEKVKQYHEKQIIEEEILDDVCDGQTYTHDRHID